MSNFSAKILNNSVSALNAQQAVIATSANNIANVNTPGYSRRVANLETRSGSSAGSGFDVGSGVQVSDVVRMADRFLDSMLLQAHSDNGSANTKNALLDQVQRLFNLTGEQSTIGDTLGKFFTAADDLAINPSSIELRTNFLASAQNLVDSIRSTYNSIASVQQEANRRVTTEIEDVNSLLAQIAKLNASVGAREAIGGTAADDRDQRQVLLNQLAGKINFTYLEQNDGSVTLSLPNGFVLVNNENARSLRVTSSPSFGGSLPPSLGGQPLSYITYDYSGGAGSQDLDLTQQFTGGSVGGLLAMRGYADPTNTSAFQATGSLVEVASRIEGLSRTLLSSVNATYLGPDRDTSTVIHNASSADLDGVNPAIFGLFTFSGAPTTTASGLPDLPGTLDNYSSQLQLAFTDPRRVAAARDTSGGAPAAASYSPGDASNIRAIGNLQSQSYTFSVGNYSLAGTFDDAYNETVTRIGNEKARAETDARVASGNLETAQNKRDEISGVSLDEEFTGLIKFQKAYQAAARMVKVGQDLLDEVIRLI